MSNQITNGNHKILFKQGKLFLDGIQIAGEGIIPDKEVVFEFQINKPEEKGDDSILEVSVHDSIKSKDLGPGQG